jgi:hypothetical protein
MRDGCGATSVRASEWFESAAATRMPVTREDAR